jgi:hypothetical protein
MPAAYATNYKLVVTLLAREADAENTFEKVGKQWSSLHSVTDRHILFVLGAKNAAKNLLTNKTTNIVSGGAWGRRPHTADEATMLQSDWICCIL